MNNAFILEEDIVVDTTGVLRERKVELIKLISAINGLSKNKDWQLLKELLFDKQTERVEKNLQNEVKKNELDLPNIYRLQGELRGARYDIYKLAETYKTELNNITKKLNEVS